MKNNQSLQPYGSPELRTRVISKTIDMIDGGLKNYKEPSRKGKAKGDPIGFSKKKMRAASLMVLHPYCLKLWEIAKIAGVSDGVLRVWCHRDDFVKEWQKISRLNGAQFAELIRDDIIIRELSEMSQREGSVKPAAIETEKSVFILKNHSNQEVRENFEREGKRLIEIDDSPERWPKPYGDKTDNWTYDFMESLPWYNDIFQEPIVQMLEGNMHIEGFVLANYKLIDAVYYWEDVSPYRVRKREIKSLRLTKKAFEVAIEMLTDPNGREKLRDYEGLAKSLKVAIDRTLDILAA